MFCYGRLWWLCVCCYVMRCVVNVWCSGVVGNGVGVMWGGFKLLNCGKGF